MPTSKAKMKTLTDVPWQRKGCRHSKEFRRDRQSYMDIGKESQIKCLWLGAGVFVLPVTSLCVWGFGPWPIPFFFLAAAFLLVLFCTTRDYLCNFTWTLVTLATRGGKCLIRRKFPVTENLDLIWTTWHTKKIRNFRLQDLEQANVCVCVCIPTQEQPDSSYLYAKSQQRWAFAGVATSQSRELKTLHSVLSGYLHGLLDVYTSRQFYL